MRALAYTFATTAIVLGFTLAEWWTEKYVADRSRVASTTIEIAIVVAAALVFRPIHRWVERSVDSAFMQRQRRALAALAAFRREIPSFSDIAQLLRRVIESIEHHLEANAAAVYLRRDVFRAEASSFDVAAEHVELDDPLAIRLRSTGAPARPQLLKSAAKGTHAFPMTIGGDLVGFLAVDAKAGDYEAEEAAMLCALASELAVALIALDPLLRSQKPPVANNIPADLPPLIGRERELLEIKALLDQSRVVTLTGAGGVGKTRLALHLASEMRRYEDGVWFVDLSPVSDPELVAATVGSVFRIADEGGSLAMIERVAAALRDRHLLIVLDNCEHLIMKVAESASYLLQSCPRIQILATSREPLGLPSEEPYRMPSLPLPDEGVRLDAQSAMRYDSIALFVARARTADRAFALTDENAPVIANIVRRIDGIAMAIELTAPRVKVLSLGQITERLDERFKLLSGGARTALPRHQTLHALIAWSFELLDETERTLLRRLAVFRGSFNIEAAEAVCFERATDTWNVINVLEALVDKSLVTVQTAGDGTAYRLLESTREFALARLEEAGESHGAYARHCRYFTQLAREIGNAYWQTDSDAWLARVRDQSANLRAAVAWGLDGNDPESAAAIVGDLRWAWYAAARREGNGLLTSAMQLVDAAWPVRTRGLLALTAAVLDTSAKAVTTAAEALTELQGVERVGYAEALAFEGIALGRGGRIAESTAFLERALGAARAIDAPRLIGWVLSMAAYWKGAAGDDREAAELFDEAASVLRFCGDPWQLARLQLLRAEFHFAQADHALALQCAREAESVFRARHHENGLCISVLNACAYLLAMGRFDEAWIFAREGLELARRLDNEMACAWAIGHLAEVAAETGDASLAARLLGRANAVYEKTGGKREPTEQRGYERTIGIINANLAADRASYLMSEGAALEAEAIVEEAMTIPQPHVSRYGTA